MIAIVRPDFQSRVGDVRHFASNWEGLAQLTMQPPGGQISHCCDNWIGCQWFGKAWDLVLRDRSALIWTLSCAVALESIRAWALTSNSLFETACHPKRVPLSFLDHMPSQAEWLSSSFPACGGANSPPTTAVARRSPCLPVPKGLGTCLDKSCDEV